ncbi:MAG: hybrid sensor histidine kinase/response regulator [Candidatus Sumerlaeaceae bacterium]
MSLSQTVGELLVVDDNKLNREMLSRRLIRKGYNVTEAENGNEALQLINDHSFDLALLDIMMPGISGIEALEVIRRRHSAAELPVIMATAKTQSEDVVEALRLGANDYITKPIDFPVLLARVQTHLNLKRLFKLKDEFLSIASHDLKNPLFVIVCQAYLIQNKVPPGTPMTEEAFDMINKISQHARTMQQIIADFLDFQSVEEGHIKLATTDLDLNELGARVVDTQQSYAAEKEIELTFHPDGNLPSVAADSNRIEQVVQNLVGNALKFNPRGGQVQVRTRALENAASLEVADRGPGLSNDDLQRVFNKYGKLSRTPTGGEKSSGLGLAICKKMIDLHGGEIGVRNNPEGGATFWFSVPVLSSLENDQRPISEEYGTASRLNAEY